MPRQKDSVTGDLFAVPVPAPQTAGTQDYRHTISALVAEMLDGAARAGKDRFAVAADMSRLTGRDISKPMLDGYSSPARGTFNLPFVLAPVLEVACDAHLLGAWYADRRGGQFLLGADTINAEIGRLEREAVEAKRKSDDARRRAAEMKAFARSRA